MIILESSGSFLQSSLSYIVAMLLPELLQVAAVPGQCYRYVGAIIVAIIVASSSLLRNIPQIDNLNSIKEPQGDPQLTVEVT